MNNSSHKKIKPRSFDVIFTLLLFCLFTFTVMTTLISGVSVYKNTEELMLSRYEERTALAYIITKVHNYDIQGNITVKKFGETDALIFTETIGGIDYLTYIYCHEGWLRELFIDEFAEFEAHMGENIVEAEKLNFTMKTSDLVYIRYESDGGKVCETHVNIRSGR